MRVGAVILAAGRGERFGADKVLQSLGGKPVWKWSYDAFKQHDEVSEVGIVCSSDNIEHIRSQAEGAAFVILGGDSRQESSRMGFEGTEADLVLIHDAARPFVSADMISAVIASASAHGAAAPAIAVTDTIRGTTDTGLQLLDRSQMLAMQTPQAAKRELLNRGYANAPAGCTDELALIEAIGHNPVIVPGDPRNFKITTSDDLAKARGLLGGVETRTGIGYDIHAFSADPARPLVLGGVVFTGEGLGLDGHSDADVVMHAATDALLGALAQGDIGQHFPNTDPRWKGQASGKFLQHAANLLSGMGWALVHLDIAIIAERPKVMKRAQEIRSTMADCLGVVPSRISLKATTNEGLGSLGRAEGIAAYAVATIRER